MQEGAERSRAMLAELRSDPRLARQLRMAPVQTIRELPFLSLAEKTALVRLGRDVLSGWEDASGCGCGGSCGGCAGATAAKGGCSGGCGGGCAGKHTEHATARTPRREVCAKCKGLREDCVCAELANTAWPWEAMGASVPMHVAEARAGKASASAPKASCEACAITKGCKACEGKTGTRGRPVDSADPLGTMFEGPGPTGTSRPGPPMGTAGGGALAHVPGKLEVWRDGDLLFAAPVDPWMQKAWGPLSNLPFDASDIDWKGQPAKHRWEVVYAPGVSGRILTAQVPGQPCARQVPLMRRSEAHFFTRDPDELYQTLITAPYDTNRWESEARTTAKTSLPPYHLPVDVVVPFDGANGATSAALHLRPEQFWSIPGGFGVTTHIGSWRPPGDAPNGYGSVKSIRHVPHALCEFELPFAGAPALGIPPVLRLVVDELVKGVIEGCGEQRVGLDAEIKNALAVTLGVQVPEAFIADLRLDYVSAVSYWRERRGFVWRDGIRSSTSGLESGFLLRLRLHVDAGTVWLLSVPPPWLHALMAAFLLPPPPAVVLIPWDLPAADVGATYKYAFVLRDGLLALEPEEVSVVPTGGWPTWALVASALRKQLSEALPQKFAEMLQSRQGFPPDPFQPPAAVDARIEPDWACGPRSDRGCGAAADYLMQGAIVGARRLGLVSDYAIDPIREAIVARMSAAIGMGADDASPEGVGNWRCVPIPEPEFPGQCRPPTRGQCQFILRAVGLVGGPDSVFLQWFNRFPDFDNPAFVAWLATFAGDDVDAMGCVTPSIGDSQQMCTPRRSTIASPPGAFTIQGFKPARLAYFERVYETANAGLPLGPPITCPDRPKTPGIPAACWCRFDNDCGVRERCIRQPGAELGRCGGRPCDRPGRFQLDPRCYDHEECAGPYNGPFRCQPLPPCGRWGCDAGMWCDADPRFGSPQCRWSP